MANTGELDYVRVYYTNGVNIPTEMNPKLTDKEIRDYFKVGRVFNIGNGENDRMTKVKRVVIHRKKT